MQMLDKDALMKEMLDYLMQLKAQDGAWFITRILATYLDLHIDRKSDVVPAHIRQCLAENNIRFIRRQAYFSDPFPEAEHYWASLFLEFHMRILALRIDMAELPPQRTPKPTNIPRRNLTEHAQSIAKQLFALPIDETLAWLTQLTLEWALCYDLNATRQQLIDDGYSERAMGMSDLTLKYQTIKVVAYGTEF